MLKKIYIYNFLIEKHVSYPKHLPQIGVSEAEGDVGDVKALGLGLARPPLLITPTSCPSPRWYGRAQRLRVRGHRCQSILLAAGKQVTWQKAVGSEGGGGGEGRWRARNNIRMMGNGRWENKRV